MKYLLSILSIGAGILSVSGQQNEATHTPLRPEAVYLEGSMGFVSPGFNSSINMETNSGWGISAGIRNLYFDPPHKPAGYSSGSSLVPSFVWNTSEQVRQVYLAGTYTFREKGRNRKLTLECGPSIDRIERISYRKVTYNGFTGPDSYYTSSRSWKRDIGMVSRAKVHLPIGRYAGFTVGAFGSLNAYRPFFGAEIGFSAGLIRRTNRNPN
jgi:hypothetical protein